MKYLNKLFILTLCFASVFISCDNDKLIELNNNPTAAEEVDWRFLFTQGQLESVQNRYINGRVHLGLTSHAIQHMATLEIGERGMGDKYTQNEDTNNAYQDRVYREALKSFGEVIRQTGPDGLSPTSTNLFHAAQVMYAFPMHIMTDLYGNVPYTEANQGIQGIFNPVYDSQEVIYKGLLAKLEAASNGLGSGSDALGAADILYGGDLTKWKKLANSLMLRLAMRLSEKDAATAQEFVQKAISGGVMTSNDDSAIMLRAEGPSLWLNQNGLSRAMIPDDWGAQSVMSKTLIDFLKDNDDPRLMIYTGGIGPFSGPFNTDPAAQQGMPNGFDGATIKVYEGTTDDVNPGTTYSRMNVKLLDRDESAIMMNYAEVEFLLAEAAMRGWGATDAEAHYNAGVKASMQQWVHFDASFTVSDAQVTAYLAAKPFDGTMADIAQQHWASNFMQWYEAFSNYRRLDLPALVPNSYPGNITNGQIFKRLRYFTTEAANNPNVATTGTTPDDYTTKVWWDVN